MRKVLDPPPIDVGGLTLVAIEPPDDEDFVRDMIWYWHEQHCPQCKHTLCYYLPIVRQFAHEHPEIVHDHVVRDALYRIPRARNENPTCDRARCPLLMPVVDNATV